MVGGGLEMWIFMTPASVVSVACGELVADQQCILAAGNFQPCNFFHAGRLPSDDYQ